MPGLGLVVLVVLVVLVLLMRGSIHGRTIWEGSIPDLGTYNR